MAGLRELRKRLRSIRTTGQLAGAMRTAAAAKYARVNAALSAYRPYEAACKAMLARLGGAGLTRGEGGEAAPECLVLLGGNRGLCGGYHAELMREFYAVYAAEAIPPTVVACGKKAAAYCREKGIPVKAAFLVSDTPSVAEARALSEALRAMYAAGQAAGVTLVRQKWINMLRQTPETCRLLPAQADGMGLPGEDDLLLLPDRETVGGTLAVTCFDAEIYAALLESAAGVQAATLMAMRSACDNATESAEKLETAINRRRQAEVTASVIETSSDNL